MAKSEYEVNEKIRIDLINGREIEGEFVQENPSSIIVKNSKDLLCGKQSRHNQTFYLSEIKTHYSINNRERATNTANGQNGGEASGHVNGNIPMVDAITKKTFDEMEVDRIQNAMKHHVYIAQYDKNYHDAIADLKQQKIIAVNSENNFGRLETMRPLIAVASGERVYLFDMLRLGAMKKEFKAIFIANSPRKIIHRSAQFCDYLAHTEKCTINNVFDTLMVHFALKQTRECISLLDCFKTYFDLPENSFEFAAKRFNFNNRPLEMDAKLRSALNVQLLTELYWFLNDVLMTPVRIASQQFSGIYQRVDNQVDLMTEMNDGAYVGVENIDINGPQYLEETFETLRTDEKKLSDSH